MKLSCTIYFGTVQLQTKQSASPPELKSATVDSRGNQICIFSFEQDKFDFAELDSSEYDLEQEMGGYPYAVFGLDYVIEHSKSGRVSSRQPRSTINLAWARLRLYQTRTDALDNQEPPGKKWDLKVGKHVCRLYPGKSLDEGCRTTPDSSRFVDGKRFARGINANLNLYWSWGNWSWENFYYFCYIEAWWVSFVSFHPPKFFI